MFLRLGELEQLVTWYEWRIERAVGQGDDAGATELEERRDELVEFVACLKGLSDR